MDDYDFAEDVLNGLAEKIEGPGVLREIDVRLNQHLGTHVEPRQIQAVLNALADIFRGD